MDNIIRYLLNYFLSIDQVLNAILLGHPDETLSSRLGRSRSKERYFWVKYLRQLIDSLFFFDKGIDPTTGRIIFHCEKSILPLEQITFRTVTKYELWSWSENGIS